MHDRSRPPSDARGAIRAAADSTPTRPDHTIDPRSSKRRPALRLLHLLTPVALVSQPVLADCRVFPGFIFDSKHGQVMVSEVRIDAAPGLILRYRASSEINTDGSAISYNLDGTDAGALNTMCNGTNAVLADGSRYSGVVTDAEKASAAYARLDAAAKREFGRQKCRRLLELFSAARRTGFDPRRFPRMDFYAVARARRQAVPATRRLPGLADQSRGGSNDPR